MSAERDVLLGLADNLQEWGREYAGKPVSLPLFRAAATIRDLERQLAEAREQLAELRSKYAMHHAEAERLMEENRRLARERGEDMRIATAKMDKLAKELASVREQRDELIKAVENHLPFIPDMEPIGAAKFAESNVTAWELRRTLAAVKGGAQ